MPRPPSLRQLRYLLALSETGHFGRAAERMGIAQPSLSVQIANLEEALQLKLYERGRGPFRLTPEGREITLRAREVVAEMQGILDLSDSLRSGQSGTLRLGTTPTLGPYLLPHVVGALHEAYPELKLYIREAAPRDLEVELDHGRHDVILTQLPVSGESFVTERLFREPLALALPADHPLAAKEELGEADLSGLVILGLGPAYVLHGQISALCRELGAELRADYEGTSLDALRQMVAMGMGASFLPMLYVRSEVEGRDSSIAVRRFRRGRLDRSVGLVRRRTSGKTAGIAHISDALRQATKARFADILTLE
ncbi:LysR substrate-binding domain-containing protein [Roseivivax sp. GX 12232]|uniref:hydrogen peroxide-inducible genes activator n=1 Tax=Roseivivax sp. GX 12232 TaxID=2900547 RepID=UPI001E2FB5C6|nr:hydrogen peroxide-inducible genes activator [Roseivivax sp. GX 12232]MCE0505403.1 LysR substrate-binding domain-containing protein [Roseivivax sp. GX 12232]